MMGVSWVPLSLRGGRGVRGDGTGGGVGGSRAHLQVDVGGVLRQHAHHLGEALVDGDVQRRAQGVVEQVDVGAFAQQQTGDLRLVSARQQHTHTHTVLTSRKGDTRGTANRAAMT